MAVSDAFRDFVVEQLGRCAPAIRFKRMFGGGGLYSHDRIFALLDNDTLYLKADAESRSRYLDARMLPFSPFGDPAQVMAYHAVPGDVLEDVEQLQPWVTLALEVAARAGRKPRATAGAAAVAKKAAPGKKAVKAAPPQAAPRQRASVKRSSTPTKPRRPRP